MRIENPRAVGRGGGRCSVRCGSTSLLNLELSYIKLSKKYSGTNEMTADILTESSDPVKPGRHSRALGLKTVITAPQL